MQFPSISANESHRPASASERPNKGKSNNYKEKGTEAHELSNPQSKGWRYCATLVFHRLEPLT